jgi:hypothetical protein
MEVHAHSHPTPGGTRKKWTHYFWEFLMLFLAVFCGFLAEYQLEHVIEHQREKQFMRSLVEDLQTDTVEIQKAIALSKQITSYSDSTLYILLSYKQSDSISSRLARVIGMAGQRLDLINTDRTSSQLKNSGAMRLIRKKNVSDSILSYWKQIEETQIGIDRYMIYRDASRALLFKLWVIPDVYRSGMKMSIDSIKSLRVIDKDPKKWDELANLMAISGSIARVAHNRNLHRQLEMAIGLIDLIRKEYNIK